MKKIRDFVQLKHEQSLRSNGARRSLRQCLFYSAMTCLFLLISCAFVVLMYVRKCSLTKVCVWEIMIPFSIAAFFAMSGVCLFALLHLPLYNNGCPTCVMFHFFLCCCCKPFRLEQAQAIAECKELIGKENPYFFDQEVHIDVLSTKVLLKKLDSVIAEHDFLFANQVFIRNLLEFYVEVNLVKVIWSYIM